MNQQTKSASEKLQGKLERINGISIQRCVVEPEEEQITLLIFNNRYEDDDRHVIADYEGMSFKECVDTLYNKMLKLPEEEQNPYKAVLIVLYVELAKHIKNSVLDK